MLNSLLKIKLNLVSFLILISYVLGSTEVSCLDFDTVLSSALKNSPELKKAKANSDEIKSQLESTKSFFLPRAGIESRYETLLSNYEKNYGATANTFIEWNIFNGFKDYQTRKSLELENNIAQISYDRFIMNLKWMTLDKYAKAFAKQAIVLEYKNAIQLNKMNLAEIKIRKLSGRISESDFLECQLFGSKLEQKLISMETEAAESLADLESFSGVSSTGELSTVLKPKRLKLDHLNFNELLFSDKSLLYADYIKIESAAAKVELVSGGFFPQISLKATYGSLGLKETMVSPEFAFGINAKWEFFSGFETVNNRKVALQQLYKIQTDYDSNKTYSYRKAEQLRNVLNNLMAKYEIEEGNQKNLTLFLKTVQSEYRRGVKSSSELNSAINLVLETRIDKHNLVSDYFFARYQLQELLGLELKEI